MTTQVYEPPPHGFRTFVVVWATQSVSFMGTAVAWFALTVWLSQQSQTQEELGARLALIGLVGALPPVFAAPLAGAFVDRHDRKQTMLVCDVLSGLLALGIAFLLGVDRLTFPLLVGAQFLLPLIGAFHSAAFDTSYAMLLRDEQLTRANGMMQTIWSMSSIVAPGLAALLITLPTGVVGTLLADAATFFAAALTLVFLDIPSPHHADLGTTSRPRQSYWADIKEGGRFIWDRRPILWLLATFAISNFGATAMFVLEPVVVRFQLAPDAARLGLEFAATLAIIQTAGGIGGVTGGVLISAWGGLKQRRVYGVLIPIALAGILQVAFGLSTWVYVSAAIVFLIVFMVPIMNAHSQSIWQTQTPRELQGRVFSVRRLIAWVFNPASTALAGILTARGMEAGTIIAALGVLIIVWCVANLFNPQLARVDDKGYLDEYAAQRRAVVSGQ